MGEIDNEGFSCCFWLQLPKRMIRFYVDLGGEMCQFVSWIETKGMVLFLTDGIPTVATVKRLEIDFPEVLEVLAANGVTE